MSVARHSGYNLAAALVPVAVSLLTIPPYIAALGEARYGVLALLTLLLGYFGVFDLGISAATAQRIAAAPPGDREARRRIVWTAAAINLGLGALGGAAILPAAWLFLGGAVTMPEALRPELLATIGWLALAVPLLLLSEVLRGALIGSARFAELSAIGVVGSLLSQLAPLAAAWWIAPRLTVVVPVLYATRLLALAALAVVVERRVVGRWTPTFDRGRVRDLFAFGGWVAISGLIGPLMVALDRFVIGALLGARAVSHYTVPFQLAERMLILPGALAQALFPRIAAADQAEAQRLGVRALRWSAALMTPAMVAGILFVGPFLGWWLGPEFAAAATVPAQILLAGFWLNALGICCHVRLQAAGRPRLIATAHLIELLPYLALLAAGLHWYGLEGAAAAFGLRIAADDVLLGHFAGLLGEVLRLAMAALPLFAVAAWLAPKGLVPALALLAAVAGGALAWLWGERGTLLAAVRVAPPAAA